LIRREVVGARWNLRHWNMQGAFQSANIKLSRFPDIENRMRLPRGARVRKLADRDCV
jgi:hypothetical protein